MFDFAGRTGLCLYRKKKHDELLSQTLFSLYVGGAFGRK